MNSRLIANYSQNRCPEDGTTHIYSATLDGWLMAIPATTPHDEPYPQDGRPQACVIVYKFSNPTGWLSFFVATESYRGYGIGRELFKAGMEYFQSLNTEYIGLDSVAEQRGTYGRRGFVETGLVAICERPNAKEIPVADEAPIEGERIVDLKSLSLEELAKSDFAHSGLERSRLWTTEALFHRRDATGLAVVDQRNALIGWLLIRKCEVGYRFGPVYAERKGVASLLLRTAMQNIEDNDASLIAETWHSNKDAVSTFEELGWKWTGSFHRMWYNGKVPAAQSPGGKAERETYAVFDAAQG
jgi:GNAT superfamily N-acetyltransferase